MIYHQTMQSDHNPSGLTFLEQARRAQIVDCAIAALAEDGYAGATMARIAQRAGVSNSVIVYHFGTKDRVFEQVADEVFRVATERLQPELAAAPDAAGRLRAYLTGRIDFLRTHRAHMLALFEIWMNLRGPGGALRFGEQDAEQTVDAIEQLLRDGQRTGEFGPFDPEVVAMTVRQTIDGVLLQLRHRPDLDLDRYAAEIVALFDRATRPATDTP